jgi:hypothetical protein
MLNYEENIKIDNTDNQICLKKISRIKYEKEIIIFFFLKFLINFFLCFAYFSFIFSILFSLFLYFALFFFYFFFYSILKFTSF